MAVEARSVEKAGDTMALGKRQLKKWQEAAQRGGKCSKCGRAVPVLTVDHIVPVSILDMLDDTGEMKYTREDNFQMLCYPCNRFKAGRIEKMCPKTRTIILELLGDAVVG